MAKTGNEQISDARHGTPRFDKGRSGPRNTRIKYFGFLLQLRTSRPRSTPGGHRHVGLASSDPGHGGVRIALRQARSTANGQRSEEHTSELQSRGHLVCRLQLEKK